jgi:thioredoxin reductase
MTYDAIIIGGSYAGISAALQLARARRRVLVVDGGQRRNRFASSSHGFLTQDGSDPAAIAGLARTQLLAYPTVTWRDDLVVEASVGAPFTLVLASGERVSGARVILAMGITDELPDLPGMAERWGTSIFHCPYCHGYELDGGRVGVIASHPMSHHAAQMLMDWGPTTFFTRGLFEPDAEATAGLARRGVIVERAPIVRITKTAEVELADGRALAFAGLFVLPTPRLPALVSTFGCAIEQGHIGPFVQTDATKETSIKGVFACGDLALPAGSVAFAVADGARAGFGAHQSLIFR